MISDQQAKFEMSHVRYYLPITLGLRGVSFKLGGLAIG